MSEKKMLQGIASILEETLPEDWSKVVFYAEYAEGAFSIEYYVAGSGKDDFVKCFDQKGVSRASLMKNFMGPFAVWCGWVCQVVTVLRSSLPQVR